MIDADPDVVRATIAATVLQFPDECGPGSRVGRIELHPHQQTAVTLVTAAIAEFGGALLADDVGLGKTFVALAAARGAARLLVVAPAVLRSMWATAAAQAERAPAAFVSFEHLSRSEPPCDIDHDFLIVDEAHHARTPSTRRYGRLAALASTRAPVLLLSATPVHNRPRDLAALLGLFLGARSRALGDAELARCVVRRERWQSTARARLPRVRTPQWITIGDASTLLDAILALPPPLAAAGGGDGGALVAHALVRQWASSEGALTAALRRRLAVAAAMRSALESGRHPTRSELSAWAYADGAQQLAFPELLASSAVSGLATGLALAAVHAHEVALRALLRVLSDHASLDQLRAQRLRELRSCHPGSKIVAFTTYAATAESLARELRRDAGVCVLTGRTARVAGGRLTRTEALARFAPVASGVRPPSTAETIELLITTDLLSEGVSLHDACVVVHLDLPWTAARLEQRVGRVARLGSVHPWVSVYAVAPPASAAQLLETERVIRRKFSAARRLVGAAGGILPPALNANVLTVAHSVDSGTLATSVPEHAEAIRAVLRRWAADPAAYGEAAARDEKGSRAEPLVAAIAAPFRGFLAILVARDERLLLASGVDGSASDAPAAVRAVIEAASGPGRRVDPSCAARALAAVARWSAAREARSVAGIVDAAGAHTRRRVVTRIAAITRGAAAHRRPLLAPLAVAARRAATVTCGAGAERVLDELAGADAMPDEAWLRAVAAFGALHGRSLDEGGARAPATPAVVALLLLSPDPRL